jgi:hypothetical protein
MEGPRIPQEMFLSHCSEDRDFADQLANVLRDNGVPVWYSPTNILAAQQWHDEIGAALKRCDWFMVVISPDALQSFWVKRELCYALQQRRYLDRITPVLFRGCDYEQLSWTLSALQIVNFAEGFDKGCRDLLRVWGVGYRAS